MHASLPRGLGFLPAVRERCDYADGDEGRADLRDVFSGRRERSDVWVFRQWGRIGDQLPVCGVLWGVHVDVRAGGIARPEHLPHALMRFAVGVLGVALLAGPRISLSQTDGGLPVPIGGPYPDKETAQCMVTIDSIMSFDRLSLADRRKNVEPLIPRARECIEQWVAEKARLDADRAKEEQYRREKASVRAKHDEAVARLSADQAWMRLVTSALICYDDGVVARSKAEIEKEKLYARRGGGVVDKGKLYELQQHMRSATENRALALADLRTSRKAKAACSNPTVRAIAACMMDSDDDDCSSYDAKVSVELVEVPEGATWTCRGTNCD